jgi:hypothetical protein
MPKPALSARNLLAAGSKAAHSSRDKAALRNDKEWGCFCANCTITSSPPILTAKARAHRIKSSGSFRVLAVSCPLVQW